MRRAAGSDVPGISMSCARAAADFAGQAGQASSEAGDPARFRTPPRLSDATVSCAASLPAPARAVSSPRPTRAASPSAPAGPTNGPA